jgi:hypothetical protein
MHNAKAYCRDLSNRFSIRISYLVVSLTAHPIVNDHKISIKSDMINFRYMVDKFINDHLKKSGCETEFLFNLQLVLISLFSCPFFFFLTIEECSFLQFLHPIFFNGEDRIKFITLVTHY